MSFRCQKCNQAFITKRIAVRVEDKDEMRTVPEKPNRVVTKRRNTSDGCQIAEEQDWCDGCVKEVD